ncbi:MAG TPA: FtsQ-type POTRA domain-containing protein [Solirubrobacteraceae bacterium]|jgi:cell division protein FtsQ|nr:FtsQ-type POTRA domain-containing protein [Solirubrobacteraceae bacterium]
MDRTIAAGAAAGRLGGASRRVFPPGAGARRALAPLLAALGARRRLRLTLICALVVLPLLAGGWMWLRHSSLVAVEHVRVTGTRGAQARAIDGALTEAAHGMSTLAPDVAKLKAAVARFPQVSEVRADPSFPHGMRITVLERAPVAALLVGGSRIAVGADGTVLGTTLPNASLPAVADDVAPASGARVGNELVRQALTVLGAAPAALLRLAGRAYFSTRGLTVAMRGGLLVYFGDATRPHAKWLALASVLADSSSAGAVYVDVRSPERAAAGFAAGAGPRETEGGTGEAQIGKGESTVGTLAAKLAEATPEGRAKAAGGEAEEKRSEAASQPAGAGPSGGAAGGEEAEGAEAEPSG